MSTIKSNFLHDVARKIEIQVKEQLGPDEGADYEHKVTISLSGLEAAAASCVLRLFGSPDDEQDEDDAREDRDEMTFSILMAA